MAENDSAQLLDPAARRSIAPPSDAGPSAERDQFATSGAVRRLGDRVINSLDQAQQAETVRRAAESPPPEWEPVPIPMGPETSRRMFKAKGTLRVEADTAVFGVDGLRFTVDWHPLDKNGKVLPVFRRNGDLQERFAPTVNVGGAQFARPRLVEPPFKWPHGFRVTVTIPPQQAVNGASPGPLLNLSVPKGGLLK